MQRLKIIPKLPTIFKTIKPVTDNQKFIFTTDTEKIIIKKEKEELHLLSLYPK